MKYKIGKRRSVISRLVLSTVVALSLSACGSGGSGDTPSTPTVQNITYEALPNFLTVNEGEVVRLSLNTKGSGASELKFKWTVRYLNQDISFSGQGTDTISFIAPGVDSQGTVQVSVDLEAGQSKQTFGFQNQYASLNIKDLNTSVVPTIPAQELGEEVSQIDTSVLIAGSTWIETHQSNFRINQADNSYNMVDLTLIRSFVVNGAEQNLQTVSTDYCGFNDLQSIKLNESVLETECPTGVRTTQLFQQESRFSIVQKCDGDIVGLSTFKKKSSEQVSSFGSLNLSFQNYSDIQTKEVCGVIATTHVKAYSASNQELTSTDSTAIRLLSQQEGSDFELRFAFNDTTNGLLVSLNRFFDENNTAAILSAAYPELNASSESGMLTLDLQNTTSHINGEFYFTVTKTTGSEEEVEGEFTLILE
ncbi:hypothetical protein N474_07145 [Pseudoalteromonas luteoviolacea CPMOR-2]|uniref:Uncharacterized protein n=1 Tax=Pseudoalteromonas luteoviolacea DSM 6061 TaxID=1365250 RepID=A0A166WE05_9GAMM|nr:hypothetical protein [Pseudoalteromonas luteoviolacea]KZN37286.1 hypothetical protein N475_16455 [Pseudoalteromonas luteoviolacea DSM 6061]KZN59462.1 hypothetical protein N474_07145 [Pseudoalteromonas luteoviolacea CPMOR-2]MBE0387491.1 hypothetical protein [Pseudoalteromonas luteoviolacea DSM 6061]